MTHSPTSRERMDLMAPGTHVKGSGAIGQLRLLNSSSDDPGAQGSSMSPTLSVMSCSSTMTSPSLPASSESVSSESNPTRQPSQRQRRPSSSAGPPSRSDAVVINRPASANGIERGTAGHSGSPVCPRSILGVDPKARAAPEPRFLWWDKLYLEICIGACRLAILFKGVPLLGDFFRRLTLLSGAFDTNASLCMFLRYLYSHLPAPLNFDPKERYFARMFLEAQYHIFEFIIRHLGLRFLPPLLRPLYKTYYARAVGASDFVERSITERGVTQIVILGAGFDTNAYRSRSLRIVHKTGGSRLVRNVQVFELDLQRVQKFKLNIMKKTMSAADFHHYTEGVHFIPIDFATQNLVDVLLADGFDPGEPTAMLWEGVTYYLPRPTVESTLKDIQRLAAAQREALGITEPGQPQPLWLFMDYMLETETLKKGQTSKDRIWSLATRQAEALGTSFITGFKDVVKELKPFDLHVVRHVLCDDVATSLFVDAPEEMRVLVERNTTHGHNEPYLNLVECVFVEGGELQAAED